MKLALAIHTFPGANDTVRRHWPNFLGAGADQILIIGTTDGGCETPKGATQEFIGANLHIVGNHLPLRLLHTFQRLSETKNDWFCIAEYDILFFKKVPRNLPEGLTAHLAGGKPFNCHCNSFYHGPWLCDRETAETIVKVGYELISEKTVDPSPDCFLGQIVERANIPVHTNILKSYSRNTIHPPPHPWADEARAAVDAGAVAVHGVKDQAVFDALTK